MSTNLELAAHILAECRRRQPDFFRPDPDLVQAWAMEIGRFASWPVEVWPEAVSAFYREAKAVERPGVGDIIRMGRVVLQRWEVDPVRREDLRRWREGLCEERDRQIRAGTFGALRGYQRRELVAPTGATGRVIPEAYGESLGVGCPVCGAPAGEGCKRGGEVKKVPHVVRMRVANGGVSAA